MDNYSEAIFERNEVPIKVERTFEFMGDTMWAMIDETTDEKGEYILYNTVSFLMDEGAASIELIAKSVMLDESKISSRVTKTFATAPEYNLERPHHLRTSDLISEAL